MRRFRRFVLCVFNRRILVASGVGADESVHRGVPRGEGAGGADRLVRAAKTARLEVHTSGLRHRRAELPHEGPRAADQGVPGRRGGWRDQGYRGEKVQASLPLPSKLMKYIPFVSNVANVCLSFDAQDYQSTRGEMRTGVNVASNCYFLLRSDDRSHFLSASAYHLLTRRFPLPRIKPYLVSRTSGRPCEPRTPPPDWIRWAERPSGRLTRWRTWPPGSRPRPWRRRDWPAEGPNPR